MNSIVYDSSRFLKCFKKEKNAPDGIIVIYKNKKLVFKKVLFRKKKMKVKSIKRQPENLSSFPKKDKKMKFEPRIKWDKNVDFVFFLWEEIKFVAKNSKRLYFSKMTANLEESINYSVDGKSHTSIFSIKMEGDKLIDINSELNERTTVALGQPCPPMWVELRSIIS